ncbi:MAG: S41 family peptidase [Planctomycetia bacterium]|nr:S41 family peptidase [Planctomycetia bacterium]
MPRRNITILLVALILSLFCYLGTNRYAESLAYVMYLIQMYSLEERNPRELLDSALDGMLTSLDENSGYIPPERYESLNEVLTQEFGGVGLSFSMAEKTGEPVIHFTLPQSPAAKSGIRGGDKILSIDGKSVQGLSLMDISNQLRGPVGTQVLVGVLRPATEQTLNFSITREKIQVETVEGDIRHADGTWEYFLPPLPTGENAGKIAYLRIVSFGEHTCRELEKRLPQLLEAGMTGLVLDLRDNSGGLLDAAIAICDLFVSQGVLVTTRGRGGEILHTFTASPQTLCSGIPIAILINGESASASEILAACLQDHAASGELRAICVGTRSYGKGTVQQLIDIGYLPEDYPQEGDAENTSLWERLWKTPPRGAIRMTVASYWRPNGQNIHRFSDSTEEDTWGVTPNDGFVVPFLQRDVMVLGREKKPSPYLKMLQERSNGTLEPSRSAEIYSLDPQLKKAVEWLANKP